MIDYSQNGEQKIIIDYLQSLNSIISASFLDVGANDGKTLSNTHVLALMDYSGHLVEPCGTPYKKLKDLYAGNKNIQLSNVAIGIENGEAEILSSDSHLKNGDTDLLSTLVLSEIERWKGTQTFTPEKVKVMDFESFMKTSDIKKFDFISIDAEGLDYDILIQMDLKKLECKMLCIESNSIDDQKYIDYCEKFGMKLHYKNYENLIFTI